MSDQADSLRALVRQTKAEGRSLNHPAAPAVTLAFAGAKGGVGVSNLVFNLGVALAQLNQRVLLVDAHYENPNLKSLAGLASHDDLYPGVDEPGSLRIVEGHSLAAVNATYDFVLADAGGLACLTSLRETLSADRIVVVTSPEPIALRRAERAVEMLRRTGQRPALVPSQVASVFEARECLSAIGTSLDFGHVRTDDCVRHAVRAATPLVVAHPHCAAARSIRKMARRLVAERPTMIPTERNTKVTA